MANYQGKIISITYTSVYILQYLQNWDWSTNDGQKWFKMTQHMYQ